MHNVNILFALILLYVEPDFFFDENRMNKKHETPKLACCFPKDSIPLLQSPESKRLVLQRN